MKEDSSRPEAWQLRSWTGPQGKVKGWDIGLWVRRDDEWTETFGSERLTGALLDRLTHHVHILEMNGESFGLNHSRARKKRASR